MTFTHFQRVSGRTRYAGTPREQVLLFMLGLMGECGECSEIVKKWARQGPDARLDISELKNELGDVLWYAAAIASTVGLDLDEVASQNVDKLQRRYPQGFTADGGVRTET